MVKTSLAGVCTGLRLHVMELQFDITVCLICSSVNGGAGLKQPDRREGPKMEAMIVVTYNFLFKVATALLSSKTWLVL
jgi:hypothetical protein